MDVDPSPLEQSILRDIREKTGLSFRQIGGIDTRDEAIAQEALPILREWPERIDDVRYRRAIYACFHTPHAYFYLEKVISWWTKEQDELALGLLTQDLALLMKGRDAERIWKLCQRFPPRPCHYWLVSKLAQFPVTEREAKNALVQALNTNELKAADLEHIARVHDPRIQQWFELRIESPDSRVRRIANKVAKKARVWPQSVRYANMVPNLSFEVFSIEDNLDHTVQLLDRISNEFELRIPSTIRNATFLSYADVGRWILANISTKSGAPASLWFRLEDVDTVQIVVTEKKTAIKAVVR